jgi:RNA polymerase sigma-70 factor (ECF subfamily)
MSTSHELKIEDSKLLEAVGSGDQRAITDLYDRYSKLVYSVAHRVCRDSTWAEEVLQKLFMQISWRTSQPWLSATSDNNTR